ncbi:MAG: hypothetical protein CO095_09210 [Armatimonadetes bacterium CG_4_9_14_3_um_filter_58_7]|nr:MAG: hypothetical protein CO095_09210 [Armatimonadetes bacterium CG_4_9_14_3_um_filter_58_7]
MDLIRRRSHATLPLIISLITVISVSFAANVTVPQVRLPLMAKPPTIDGRVVEMEWAAATRMVGFCKGATLAPLEASFWVGCDGKELFIAVVSETPPGGKVLSRFNLLPGDTDARTWLDDSIEMVIDPFHSGPAEKRKLYHANINAKGAIHDTAYQVGGNAEAWRGNWRTVSQMIGDAWHFEVALPLKDMGVDAVSPNTTFGIRVCRNWHQTPLASQTEWSPLGGAYLSPETIPVVTWDPAAPVAQTLQLTDPHRKGAHIVLSLMNPTDKPITVKAALHFTPKSSQPVIVSQAITIQPGQTMPVELRGSALNEDIHTILRVTSSDEKIVYYSRDFQWRLERPDAVWTADASASRKITTQFAYYPSFNKIHLRLDVSALENKEQITAARTELRRKGEAKPIAARDMPAFDKSVSELFWDIPSLGEGVYELAAKLTGVEAQPEKQTFVRHVFPWEGNKLGKSDIVVPPFTPITVQGNAVSAVLRKHTLSPLGLFAQVESVGRPLLKQPIRLEIASSGKTAQVQGTNFRFAEKKATKVVTTGDWSGGGLKGTARSEWDYDGMMKWTLSIFPSTQSVDAMTLVIPLDATLMPLMHTCTDGIRFNYAGNAPMGQGRVWDGSKAPRNSIIGSYVPYIWVGAEERGLAVFGENDRGWVTSPDVPCQELVRKGDTLELRLHLIAKPTRVDAPRQILIGFQATPTKPMPKNWRRWYGSYAMQPLPDPQKTSFIGSCWSWGALTPCLDVYPRDEDLTFWEKLKETKQTGVVDEEYLKNWIAGFPAADSRQEKSIVDHNRYPFHVMKGKPTDVVSYTNARGVRFDTREGQTFLDEWHRDAFTTRDWPVGGGVAYDLNPGESFRDYALWYYKKMYMTFTDHIYWDDIFMQSDFDPIGTEAYRLADGNTQPASGLFDMRELIRRTRILYHELGRTGCLNQPHITNTAIAPILSFAGSHLTWEDRAGTQDFQDRFPRDYIRAESTGRQHGNVSFALLLLHGTEKESKEKVDWIKRTAAGVLLVHEMRHFGPIKDQDDNLKTLYEYGYGLDGVQVYNYWDDNLPIVLSRKDAVHLIATKPGSALVLVVDYGEGGEVIVAPDLKRLGISGTVTAVDTESGQPVAVDSKGEVRLDLKKHDFGLIRIEGEEQ